MQLQPTWFLSKAWLEHLGGWIDAPPAVVSSTSNSIDDDDERQQKKAKLDNPDGDKSKKGDSNVVKHYEKSIDNTKGSEIIRQQQHYYRLIHPTEMADSTVNNNNEQATNNIMEKRKSIDSIKPKPVQHTLRLAEDSRLFYAHLYAGGKLHLHRTPIPLVTYRHRSGMSQSSSTPRKLLLRLRAKAWEDIVFYGNNNHRSSSSTTASSWASGGFAIWGAGRDGKDFLKSLSPAVQSKVVCFVDVDEKKIDQIKFYDNPSLEVRIRVPILHFSVLAKNTISEQGTTFGRIDKKCGDQNFECLKQNNEQTSSDKKTGNLPHAKKKVSKTKKKKSQHDSIDPEVLQQLPVVVCVAMYRTNGALESNVASIGRTEGKDLWHII